jgi:hypothetical protein
MPATQPGPTVEQQRAETFRELGFSTTHAFLLAATRQGGQYVQVAHVQRMLEGGCSHDMALRILL